MDRDAWNQRYGADELVWGAEPNRFVAEVLGRREPAGRARKLAVAEGVEVEWVCADVMSYEAAPGRFALVLVSYLQVGKEARRLVLERAAAALAPGGELFMIGHALRSLTAGVGGPRDPSVLWDPEEIACEVRSVGLRIERCEEILRPVDAEPGARAAIDVLVEALQD